MALTDKQWLFVHAYVETLNATRAAITAGYSAKTARQMGAENLSKPDIREEINKILKQNAMGAGEVLARLTEQARIDLTPYMMDDGSVDIKKLKADGKGHWIKGIKDTRYGKAIEFYDTHAALVDLGRYHTLFVDKIEHADWRSKAIDDIREGRIAYSALVDAFDEDMATQLFKAAGVPIE